MLGPGWRLTPHPQLLRSAQDPDFYTVVEDDGATVTLVDVSANDTLTNVIVRPSDNRRISQAPGLGGGTLHALGASLIYDTTACLYRYRTPEGQVWSYAWAGEDDDEDTKLLLVERTDPAGNRLVFLYDWETWESDAPYVDDRYRLDVSGSANDGQLVRIENTRTGRTVDLRYAAAPEGGVRLAWVAEQYTDETYGRRVDFAYARYEGTGPSLLSGVARSQPCQPAGLSAPAGSPIALLTSQTAAQDLQDATYAYTYRGDLQCYLLTHSLRPDGAGLVNVYGSSGLANGRVTEQKTLLGSPASAVTTTTFAYSAGQNVVTAVRDPSSSSCRTYLYSDLGVTAVVEGTNAFTDPTTTLEWNDRRQLIRSVGPDGVETVHIYDDSAPPYRLLGTIRRVPETAAGAGSPLGIAMTSYEYCTTGVPAKEPPRPGHGLEAEDTTDHRPQSPKCDGEPHRLRLGGRYRGAALETTYDTAGSAACAPTHVGLLQPPNLRQPDPGWSSSSLSRFPAAWAATASSRTSSPPPTAHRPKPRCGPTGCPAAPSWPARSGPITPTAVRPRCRSATAPTSPRRPPPTTPRAGPSPSPTRRAARPGPNTMPAATPWRSLDHGPT